MSEGNPISGKDLTETQWQRLKPLLPEPSPKGGQPARDHRTLINGILWILRTGDPWRDLPDRYGAWSTVASRFYTWKKNGLFKQFRRIATRYEKRANYNYLAMLTLALIILWL